MTATPPDPFLKLCSDLTGFSAFRLRGTGLADLYRSHLAARAGEATVELLLDAHASARAEAGDDRAALAPALRTRVMSDPRLGPPARHLLKLWYVGVWHALPADWRAAYGGSPDDVDCVPAPASYTEGLLWPAIGANPAGVKPQGYGMWAHAPRVPDAHQES